MTLEVVPVRDAGHAELWRPVHNAVIPAHPLTADDVRERLTCNRLSLAFADGEVVGNATVRPATTDAPVTVIVRVLAAHRRRGHGTAYWQRLIADDPSLRAGDVATVVLTANDDGLRFAHRLGFVEVDRYEVDGAQYADLLRAAPSRDA